MRRRITAIVLVLASCAPSLAQAQSPRQADEAAIRANIESIFQAFIDKDRETLENTHDQDWRGFLDGSRRVVRGLDGYMKAVSGALRSPAGQGMVAYRITDFDVVFHGPSIGIASFVAEVDSRRGETLDTTKLNIVDVYSNAGGRWRQVASGTSINLESIERQMAANATLPDAIHRQLLEAREAVWRAWFGGDLAALEALLPPELITLEGSRWGTRSSVIEASQRFARSGGRLTKLEFPRTDLQVYGRTALIFTSYVIETESGGTPGRESGTAVETFVMRDGKWLNTGWQLAPDAGRR